MAVAVAGKSDGREEQVVYYSTYVNKGLGFSVAVSQLKQMLRAFG
jgi:hypothetical protein